ncbi:MAG: DUF5655 domain-containing protein [Chthonomonadales bacterium]
MATVDEATQKFIQNLQEKTGVSLEKWIERVKASGHTKHKEIVNWLKTEKELTHGYANLIALHVIDPNRGTNSAEELVAGIFVGNKEPFRPAYDTLIRVIKTFGKDLEIAPKKTYVSVRRKKQFVTLEPKSSRLDVCINLGQVPGTDRLEVVPNAGMMPSHRVRVLEPSEVDKELIAWLKAGYDRS